MCIPFEDGDVPLRRRLRLWGCGIRGESWGTGSRGRVQSLCLLDFLAGDGQGEDNSVPSPPNVVERLLVAKAPAEGSDRREFQILGSGFARICQLFSA